MKTFTKFLASLVLAVVMLPAVASAQLNVTQGGTGLTSVSANNILYGVSSLRLGSEATFTYNPSTNLLTASYASTTGFSATNGDLSKLTVTYASSTGFTATNATIGTATGTQLYGFGLPGAGCNGAGQALTWNSGLFGCGTITSAGDGVSNWSYNGSRLSPSTTVGIGIFASSTIGGGTGATGLTINGGATTTGNAYFGGNVGIGTTTPTSLLTLNESTSSTGGIGFGSDVAFYRSGTGQLSLSLGGTERMRWVINSGTGQFQMVGNGNATTPKYSWSTDTNTGMYLENTSTLAFSTAGVNRVVIGSTGNIGIGTTSPSNRLTIEQNGGGIYQQRIANYSTAGDARAALEFVNDTGSQIGYLGAHGSQTAAGIGFPNTLVLQSANAAGIAEIAANASGIWRVFTGGTANSYERMRITATGNVGIGTTTPYANLTIAGTMGLSGALYDRTASAGTNGMILQTTSTGVTWVATSTLGIQGDGVSNWSYNGSRLSPSTTVGIGIFASSTIGGGTGATGLTINGTATSTNLKVTALTADRMIMTGADKLLTTSGASSVLLNTLTDETGTGVAVFSAAPTFTGRTNFAGINVTSSSTLGYASATALTVTGSTTLGSLTGFLKATTGAVATSLINLATDITGFLGITNGGTGTSTAPTTDRILVGNAGGTYDFRRIVAGSNVAISTSTVGQIQISSTAGGTSVATTSWTVCSLSTCDFVTDGTADEVQINQALSRASSTGGVVQLFAQTYDLSGPILLSGLATEGDGNPEIKLVGMGREATKIYADTNLNAIEIRNRAKYDISKVTLFINGSGSGIKGIAGTERGNWQSNIEDIYIVGDFSTMASTSWGIDLQSPFRMRLSNVEMNGVANGANLSSHTDGFNPGNLSIDRMFIDLWDNVANASATAFKLAVASSSSTGSNNLVSVNRLDIAGGSTLTNSIGVHILGSISSYGDSRHHSFRNLNIEDVKVAYKLQRARDNTFLDLNYTRVLSGGKIIELDSNSHNNKFENLYAVAQGSGQTFDLITDANGSSNLPNFLTRVDGWQPSSVSINATLAANTILEQIDLSGGSPTIDTDITIRNNSRVFQNATTTSFFSSLGTFTNLVVNTLATFLNATFTGLVDIGAGVLEIPNGTAPTVDSVGEIALDTTSDQLIYFGSTTKKVVTGNDYTSFTYATTTAWTGTTTLPLGPSYVAETWNGIQCYTDAGTLIVQVGDGTNWTNANQASTTVGTTVFSTNNTFTANEKRYWRAGTPASSPTTISCTISRSITAD